MGQNNNNSLLLFLNVIILICLTIIPRIVVGLRDGDLYKFTSLADGNVLSINSTGYFTLTSEPWQDSPGQKWLAVEAIVATDSYLLLSQRQSWDWSKFINQGQGSSTNTKGRREHLPEYTMVAGYDSTKGQIIQETFNGGKPQQWKSTSIGHDNVLIKNLAVESKCLVNVGQVKKHLNIFQKTKNKLQKLGGGKKSAQKQKPGLIQLLACDPSNDKHIWRIEVLPAAGGSTIN